LADSSILVRLADYQLKRPRQYGACWLACELWRELQLDSFWSPRLEPSREGTDWAKTLAVSVAYRLIEPGSEWRCHRLWYERSAMGDLLGEGFIWGGKDQLYGVLDRLLQHRDELFQHLQGRWRDLFGTKLEVLLYDLTSTYFEGQAQEIKQARYGYSRDHRPDCKQVVLALVVTPEGFPVGYEIMNGNTLDKETRPKFMERIEALYGKAQRVWLMDRGIPTDDQLTALRAGPSPVKYLVGTPRSQVKKTRSQWESATWTKVREAVEVKLFKENEELYVVVRSDGRQQKEIAIRRKKLARLLWTLRGMRKETQRDRLLMRWGAAKAKAGRAAAMVKVRWPKPNEEPSAKTFRFTLKKEKLKEAELYDGHYLLRSNLSDKEPEWLWQLYMLLVRIEGVFRCFKNDLGIRPIYHQNDARVEAHIFVCFQAYCLWVTLQERLRALAPGLTPRQALDQLAGIQNVGCGIADQRRAKVEAESLHPARPGHRAVAPAPGQESARATSAKALKPPENGTQPRGLCSEDLAEDIPRKSGDSEVLTRTIGRVSKVGLMLFLAARLRAQGARMPEARTFSREQMAGWIAEDEADMLRFREGQ
jgi:transposase